MPINNPNLPPTLQRPRLRLLVSTQQQPIVQVVGTALAASVSSTNNFHADRYSATLAPPASGVGSFAWWEDQTDIAAQVEIGLVPPGAPESAVAWNPVVVGPVDRVSSDLLRGTVQIEGRDFTARLIDWKTELAHVNQTSSEVVAALAAEVGLQAQVTPTATPVGRYYELEHDRIQFGQFRKAITAWDEIVMLARWEGFDAFVQGQTLCFQPAAPPDADPYVIRQERDAQSRPVSNAFDCRFERALTVAKGVQVIVKSWHAKQARAFMRGYPSARPVSVANPTVQQYVVVRPNLTEDQAQLLANRLYDEIVRHERRLDATLPGDLVLTPRVLIRVTGTGTGLDQTYYPDTIERSVGGRDGFVMHVRAKNHSPQTQAALP